MIWIILGFIIAAGGAAYYFIQKKKKEKELEKERKKPFSFGVMADVQHRHVGGYPVHPNMTTSLTHLQAAVEYLNQHDLEFVVELGDFIDPAPEDDIRANKGCLGDVLKFWNKLIATKYHVLGNHDAYIPGYDLIHSMKMPGKYYTFFAGPQRVTFVVLDQNDAEEIGRGGISAEQAHWFEGVLKRADEFNHAVVVFGHYPLLGETAHGHGMTNPQPILEIFKRHPVIVAYMAGHAHESLYGFHDGIHHLTFHGMLMPENGYAMIKVRPDAMEVDGIGAMGSFLLPFKQQGTQI